MTINNVTTCNKENAIIWNNYSLALNTNCTITSGACFSSKGYNRASVNKNVYKFIYG